MNSVDAIIVTYQSSFHVGGAIACLSGRKRDRPGDRRRQRVRRRVRGRSAAGRRRRRPAERTKRRLRIRREPRAAGCRRRLRPAAQSGCPARAGRAAAHGRHAGARARGRDRRAAPSGQRAHIDRSGTLGHGRAKGRPLYPASRPSPALSTGVPSSPCQRICRRASGRRRLRLRRGHAPRSRLPRGCRRPRRKVLPLRRGRGHLPLRPCRRTQSPAGRWCCGGPYRRRQLR